MIVCCKAHGSSYVPPFAMLLNAPQTDYNPFQPTFATHSPKNARKEILHIAINEPANTFGTSFPDTYFA